MFLLKGVKPEDRLQTLLEALKQVEKQSMILNHAFQSTVQAVSMETDQLEDQMAIFAEGFAGLFDNVASRKDIEEMERAATEDNEAHVELEETATKMEHMLAELQHVQGPAGNAEFTDHWDTLKQSLDEMDLSREMARVESSLKTLSEHLENGGGSNGSLYYFVLVNLALLFAILLWSKAKSQQYRL